MKGDAAKGQRRENGGRRARARAREADLTHARARLAAGAHVMAIASSIIDCRAVPLPPSS
jgi:hypothetical protein